MQNLTKFSQTAAGNISTPKNLAVGGTLTVTGTITGNGASGLAIKTITVTNATLGVTTGRAIKVVTSTAAANMEDGYGVVEVDTTMTGTAGASSFPMSAFSSWVNIPSGTVGAGKYVCAMNVGVYEESAATITNAKIVFGMRAQKLLGDTDGLSFPFSINTNNTAITALIDVNNNSDLGVTSGAATAGAAKMPFCRDAGGTILYINTYTG